MASSPQKVVGERSSGHYSLMFGGVARIDVSKKPLFDSLASQRPDRHNYCREHKIQLKSASYCETGDHYLKNGEVMKGADVDGTVVEFTDDEIASLKTDSDGVVELVAMLDWLDPIFFEKAWVIWPKDVSHAKAYKLLHNLLMAQDAMLIGNVIEEGTPRILALRVVDLDGDGKKQVMVAHLCHHFMSLRDSLVNTVVEGISAIEDPTTENMKIAHTIFDTLPDTIPLDGVDELGVAQWRYLKAKAENGEFTRAELETKTLDSFEAMIGELEKVAKTKTEKDKPERKVSKTKVVH